MQVHGYWNQASSCATGGAAAAFFGQLSVFPSIGAGDVTSLLLYYLPLLPELQHLLGIRATVVLFFSGTMV